MRNLVRLSVQTLAGWVQKAHGPGDSQRIELGRQPALPAGIEALLFRTGASRLKPKMVQ